MIGIAAKSAIAAGGFGALGPLTPQDGASSREDQGENAMLKGIQRIACTLLGTGLLLCMGSSGAAEDGTRTLALPAAHPFDTTSAGLRDDAVVIVQDGKRVTVRGEAAIPEGTAYIPLDGTPLHTVSRTFQ